MADGDGTVCCNHGWNQISSVFKNLESKPSTDWYSSLFFSCASLDKTKDARSQIIKRGYESTSLGLTFLIFYSPPLSVHTMHSIPLCNFTITVFILLTCLYKACPRLAPLLGKEVSLNQAHYPKSAACNINHSSFINSWFAHAPSVNKNPS